VKDTVILTSLEGPGDLVTVRTVAAEALSL
jgi:hypothetical protein